MGSCSGLIPGLSWCILTGLGVFRKAPPLSEAPFYNSQDSLSIKRLEGQIEIIVFLHGPWGARSGLWVWQCGTHSVGHAWGYLVLGTCPVEPAHKVTKR